jgi:hypothetical protein
VQAEQRRVPLVDVVLRPLLGAQAHGLEQRGAAHPQYDLLAQPVARVAAVERVGERLVVLGVLGEARVEQEHRDYVAGHAPDLVAPRAHAHRPPLDLDHDGLGDRRERVLGAPRAGALALHAVRAELLGEVALAVGEGDGHDREAQVGRGAERVAGEHAEPAAIGGDSLLEADLHREVRDGRERGGDGGHG